MAKEHLCWPCNWEIVSFRVVRACVREIKVKAVSLGSRAENSCPPCRGVLDGGCFACLFLFARENISGQEIPPAEIFLDANFRPRKYSWTRISIRPRGCHYFRGITISTRG